MPTAISNADIMDTYRVNSRRIGPSAAAERVGVSLRTLQRLTKKRLIPVQKVSLRKRLYREDDLEAYLRRNTQLAKR